MVSSSHQLIHACLYICRGEGSLSPSVPRLLSQPVLLPTYLTLCKRLLQETDNSPASQVIGGVFNCLLPFCCRDTPIKTCMWETSPLSWNPWSSNAWDLPHLIGLLSHGVSTTYVYADASGLSSRNNLNSSVLDSDFKALSSRLSKHLAFIISLLKSLLSVHLSLLCPFKGWFGFVTALPDTPCSRGAVSLGI